VLANRLDAARAAGCASSWRRRRWWPLSQLRYAAGGGFDRRRAPGLDRMDKTTSNNSDFEKQSAMTCRESKALQAAQKQGVAVLPMLPAPR